MNKVLNLFFALGLLLFMLVSIDSYGGSLGFFNCFGPFPDYTIVIPAYNFMTIICGIASIFCLSIVIIGKFKNLPDLTQKNDSYKIMADNDTFDS